MCLVTAAITLLAPGGWLSCDKREGCQYCVSAVGDDHAVDLDLVATEVVQ